MLLRSATRITSVPANWPVEGTTGYEFLNLAFGLFVNPAAEAALTQFYATFAGVSDSYADVAHEKRLLVLREGLGDTFVDYYCKIKEAEIARFNLEVSEWEHREYFDLF